MDAHQEVMQRKRSKLPTVVALIVIALLISVIVEGFFLFGSFMTVRAKARETMSSLHTYVDSVKKGDQEKLLQSAQEVHGSAHSIQHEIQTLPWTLASIAPQIGSDVRSARTLVDVLVNVSDEVLLPLAQSSELMSLSNLMHFYTEVASKSFNKLLTRLGSLDTLSFMEAVATSATEGRCNAWIADDMVEQHIKQAGFGWELPHEISSPLLGVFISDFSTSKAAYYLSLDTSMSEPTANPDGTKTYMVTTTLKHNMDRTLASGELPGYIVTGWSTIAETRSKVELLEKVSLVAPEGGVISGIQSVYAGSVTPTPEVKWSEYAYQGNNTWVADVRIDAGETCTFTYAVTVPSEALRSLEIRQSPVVSHEVRGD